MRVLVTQDIDKAGVSVLARAGLEVDVVSSEAPIAELVLRFRVRGCVGLLSMLTDTVDADLMDAAPLKVIAQHAVGVNNIDLDAARSRGIVVTHTPGVLTAATADFTMALLLGLGRNLLAGDSMVRNGGFYGWHPTTLCGLDLDGARLGIVGLGRIGRAVKQRAEAFGMEVVHHGRTGGLSLDELLRTSDVVSLHCPLTEATHHLIDREALAKMKPGALLVNTARGPVVDESALVDALRARQLGGAALDVFEAEPTVHAGLMELPNVLLAPHLGSATVRTRRKMAVMAATDLVAVLQGEAPTHRVV
ncbi:MAG: D-glycerate dehydrogenase [Deltaproteobacteria bacterium]|nr:D-glycerate dehydrogenase [Deltaproteobacteria bacterium]